jgi:hypothetical protein
VCRELRTVVREPAVELLRNAFPEKKKQDPEIFLAETFLRCLSPYHEGR